ncbi:hypothetical protein Sru01_17260 [Sphaerisporangium rufum]|uniref:TIR domain-containing protein n=1 Tax=Sphaerisporangium rufum TaxID=1381558 RepID=A0A919QZ64_9ACTN|nr:TIR-like protein FxsC [Sphaerisporangium rufum]GII76744.1 hypothetical protein Sru01_17260 [Sphaerisporangium rufum]
MSDDTRTGPYFFFSYAHTPRHDLADPYDPDQAVEKFFTELCRHVMVLGGLNGKPGFMDRELHSGSYWPDRLAESLATCRVFVPLYSRRYFESEHCGKEWAAFYERVLLHRARVSERAETIIPALWVPVPVDEMPEVARSIHFNHAGVGPRYADQGLYGIIVQQYKKDYQTAVYNLAQRIVEVGQSTRLPPGDPPDYDSLKSAFGPYEGGRLRVTVVAPDLGHLPKDCSPYYYGLAAREWNPYRPTMTRSLADHAGDLVRTVGYRPEIGSLDEHADHLFGGATADSPGLVLLDAWAVTSDHVFERLRRLDAADRPWITVMVAWNKDDPQSSAVQSRLRERLWEALPRKLSEGLPAKRSLANDVHDFDQFCRTVPELARAVMSRYLEQASTNPPAGVPSIGRPRLQSPVFPSPGNAPEVRP